VTSLLVAAVGLLSAVSMLRIGNLLSATVATELRETSDADHLQGAASRIDGRIDEYCAAVQNHQPTDPVRLLAEVDGAFDEIAQATSRLDQTTQLQPAAAALHDLKGGDAQNERRQLELINQQARLAFAEWSNLRSDINGGAGASAAVLQRLTLATGGLLRDSQDFEAAAKVDMSRALQVAQDRVTMSVRLLTAGAALAAILAIGMACFVAGPLVAQLERLREGAVELGKGDLEVRMNVGSGDEIGQLATTFNEMAAGLRRSRDEARENESKFRELAEAIHEVFWVAAPDCSKIYYISPAYEEIWGRSCESLYENPLSFADAVLPEDRPRVLASLEKMTTDGIDEEYRIVRANGTMRWIHDRGFAVRDEGGRVERMVGIAADVTNQKMAEEALRRAHAELEQRVEARTAELLQANEALRQSETDLQRAKDVAEAASRAKNVIFNTALDAIVTIDSRSVITEWNLQAETMFRWDRTEVTGMRLDQTIIPEIQWEAHRREIEDYRQSGEGPLLSKLVEILAIRRDGREFPVEVAITPAWSDGECTFTAFIRDITLRKQAEADLRQAKEAAEKASRAKSEFLANMSHEIRTPLNGVIGMSSLLLETTLDERQQRFAHLIKTSGESLSELINDILDFSKIEARKLELESVDFDLYTVVEDVTEMMSLKASQKGLELACLTTPSVPRCVKGDSKRVKQILVNLINNAIKFTEAGSITTRLTMEDQSQEQVTVKFSVTDTGIGIPADRMDRLFKSFSQVDASTTRTYGGTGLGLAISKQLAELMGGAIGVESTVGSGSTFWFTLRLRPVVQVREPAAIAAINPRGLRVLAVHDSPTMREILRTQLCGWGLEAAAASTGDEAMKMLIDGAAKARPFDVAILDAELPATNTLELGKAITVHPEIGGTVLLILIPADSDFDPLKLRAAGFSGHLVKPVRQSHLYDSIVDAMASTRKPEKVVAKPLPIAGDSPCQCPDPTPRARILIVEDNRVNQIVASEMLAGHGYGYEIVDDGEKAVAAASTGTYDLVLMDCSMPKMDGFEATRQIRGAERFNPTNPARHVPIIALTATAMKGDRERCLEAGMDDYVSKPLDPNRLMKAIEKWLGNSGPTSPPRAAIESETVTAAPPTGCAESPPLGIDALLDRCMGNVETVRMILDEFEREAVADLAEIKRHVENGDCERMARVAHALKGSSGILSADALAGIAFELERTGRAGALTDQARLLSQLNREVQRCIDYLPIARAAIAKKIKV